MIEGMLVRTASLYRETSQLYSGVPGMTTSLEFDDVDNFYCNLQVSGFASAVVVTITGLESGTGATESFSFSSDGSLAGSVKFDSLSYLYVSPVGGTVTITAVDSVGEPRVWRSLVDTIKVRYRERPVSYTHLTLPTICSV